MIVPKGLEVNNKYKVHKYRIKERGLMQKYSNEIQVEFSNYFVN